MPRFRERTVAVRLTEMTDVVELLLPSDADPALARLTICCLERWPRVPSEHRAHARYWSTTQPDAV